MAAAATSKFSSSQPPCTDVLQCIPALQATPYNTHSRCPDLSKFHSLHAHAISFPNKTLYWAALVYTVTPCITAPHAHSINKGWGIRRRQQGDEASREMHPLLCWARCKAKITAQAAAPL